MVLESDEGEGETRVAVPPELQWNIQDLPGDDHCGTVGVGVGPDGGEVGGVANHVGVTDLVTGGLGELVPDVEPVAVVLVDPLAADLDLDGLQEDVTDPVEPPERVSGVDGDSSSALRYVLWIKSPLRLMVAVIVLPQSAAPLKTCSMDSMAKLV